MDRTSTAFWMQTRNRFGTSATHTLKRAGMCVVLVLFMFSCSSLPLTHREIPPGEAPPLYSMVFIIHGDGDYLYHDTLGNAYRADKKALAGAIGVAVHNPHAEVFIFHEKPRKHPLLFFPLRDGEFRYYRHGRLFAHESYWRNQGPSRFALESDLYHRFHGEEHPQMVKLFLYFGHEIPEFGGTGYDASYSDRLFTVDDLAEGLNRFIRESPKFDLIVLSTCYSGTPHTIAALAPYAHTIVASPENLHLSYFDLQPFERLETGLADGDVSAFAVKFAYHAFDRLTDHVQTAITVAVYDVERVREYVNAVGSANDSTLKTMAAMPGSLEHCDCAEEPAYILPGMSEGVEVFYRPARFGRAKNKLDHSGWECWRRSGHGHLLQVQSQGMRYEHARLVQQ